MSTTGHHSYCTVLFDSIRNSFMNQFPGNNTTTQIYWSCHKIITRQGSTEANRSYSSYEQIYLLARQLTNRTRNSEATLMHELCHQFGAPDHYHLIDTNTGNCINASLCIQCNPTTGRPASCLMNDTRQNITNSAILCDGCKNDILAHLNDHHGYRKIRGMSCRFV